MRVKGESMEEVTVTGYNREKEEMASFYCLEQSSGRKEKKKYSLKISSSAATCNIFKIIDSIK